MKKFLLKLLKLDKQYCWQPTWLDELERNLNGFISHLVWVCFARFEVGRFLIGSLAEFEMKLKVFLNKEFREWLSASDWTKEIPKDTFYCESCPYRCTSMIAYWLLGSQSSGYCYHINMGDFSYINDTMLLWDGCKECGEYEFPDDEEEFNRIYGMEEPIIVEEPMKNQPFDEEHND